MTQNSDDLPTIKGWLESWIGFQIPSIPMPNTLKNLDKAIGTVVLATAANVKVRIDGSTEKVKARDKLVISDMFRTADEQRKFENRANTTKAAIDELDRGNQTKDADQEIDADWLNVFGRLAEDKSSKELQDLFGRILAGEIRAPGTFSLRTLQVISNLSRSDAAAVSSFLSFVLDRAIVPFASDKFTDLWAINRVRMEELSVVVGSASKLTGMALTMEIPAGKESFWMGSGFGVRVLNTSETAISVSIPGQPITTVAKELITIANPADTSIDFLVEVAHVFANKLATKDGETYRSEKCRIDIVKVQKQFADGSFEYEIVREIVHSSV